MLANRLMPRWARLIYIANDPGSPFMRRRITSSTDSVRSSAEIISRLNGRRYRETWRRRGLQHFAQPSTQVVESAGAHASARSGDAHRDRSTRRPPQRDAHTADPGLVLLTFGSESVELCLADCPAESLCHRGVGVGRVHR